MTTSAAENALAQASQLIQARDFDGAAAVLEPILAVDPRDAEAWQLLGTARYRNRDLQGAALAYEQRLKLSPNDSIAMYSLAIVLKDLGDEASARELLVRITTLDPKFAPARARLEEWGPTSIGAPPPPPPPPPAAQAQTDIPRPSAPGMVVGRARKILIGSQPDPITIRGSLMVWTFRIERVGEDGNALPPVLVTMRGSRIDGQLAEGDIVEAGPWKPGEMIRAKKATNLTTNSMIVVRGMPQWVFVAGLGLMILAFVAFALWAYQKVIDGPGPPMPQASAQTQSSQPGPGPGPGPGPEPGPTPSPEPQPTPVTLSSLNLEPASVTSGSSSTGAVTLSDAAPSGGTVASLSSSDGDVAAVQPSVTVPEGETSADFDVTTLVSSENAVATISATAGGVTLSAELTVDKSPDADQVAVQRAEYRAATREVLLEATSSASDATLTVATSTGEQIGELESNGDGTFAGEFSWPSYPEQITVSSTGGGRTTIDVELT
jgi:Tetratricopeptide repeat